MSLILTLLLAGHAPDAPRETGAERVSALSVGDLSSCFTRTWISKGILTPVPTQNGIDLYFQLRQFALAGPGKEVIVFAIRDRGSDRQMTVYYRRPWSAKTAVKLFNETVDRCDTAPPNALTPQP